ncbi:ribbon-helix-helix domain-containing protein [Pelagibius sp.]|uniref:ribbon-helix-helix domain-containing protein n=1 Tax=Pelagibius sp. TaxID=1931238 RepID=UPI003BAEC936
MPEPAAKLRKHSVKLSGHSTSLSLEGVYWDALKEVAGEMDLSMNGLIERIDKERSGNLSSAVRVFLFQYYRQQAAQGGAARLPATPPAGAEP